MIDEEMLNRVVRAYDYYMDKNEIVDIKQLNSDDFFITFRDGRKELFDIFNGTRQTILYNDVNDIPDDLELRAFKNRLSFLLFRSTYYQNDLAEKVGISQEMISRYTNGASIPNILTLRKISRLTGYTLDHFFFQNYQELEYYEIKRKELMDEEEEKERFIFGLWNMMRKRRVSQQELANRLETTQPLISRYLRGVTIPSAFIVNKMAKVLNCKMEDFFPEEY